MQAGMEQLGYYRTGEFIDRQVKINGCFWVKACGVLKASFVRCPLIGFIEILFFQLNERLIKQTCYQIKDLHANNKLFWIENFWELNFNYCI